MRSFSRELRYHPGHGFGNLHRNYGNAGYPQSYSVLLTKLTNCYISTQTLRSFLLSPITTFIADST